MGQASQEHIDAAMHEADRLLREGRSLADVVAALGVSQTTYYRWRRRLGGFRSGEIARIRELERENARLRRILADKALEIDALRELTRGSW